MKNVEPLARSTRRIRNAREQLTIIGNDIHCQIHNKIDFDEVDGFRSVAVHCPKCVKERQNEHDLSSF